MSTATMKRSFDAVVIGADANGLVAAIELARTGSKVLLLESHIELGGTCRELEFAPGFRAAPLASDAGFIGPEVARAVGANLEVAAVSDPTVISLGEGEPLLLRSSIEGTAEGLQRFSQKDAERWPAFARQMHALSGFLEALYREPAPDIDAQGMGEFLRLASIGRKFRGLGKTNMIELMRTVPMAVADLLDDWFETERLKGLLAAQAVTDVCQGPMSGGTAFTLLHRQVGAKPGVFGERLRFKAGPGVLIAALAQRAKTAGVTIETDAALKQLLVREDRVAGVALASGEEIRCRTVLSSLNPYRTLLELLDPVYLDPEIIQAVRNIRFRGVTTKVLVALEGLPDVPRLPVSLRGAAALSGALMIAPSSRYVERAYDATKYGRCSEAPFVEVRFPSIVQPDLAPAGQHVAVLHVQFTPYQLREGSWNGAPRQRGLRDEIADRAIALVDEHLPGFAARVRQRMALSPLDLETQFGLREGACSQGEMMLDQILFMRPIAGWSRYATPMPGLYLCGASTHPGGGITGMSGVLVARAALADRNFRDLRPVGIDLAPD